MRQVSFARVAVISQMDGLSGWFGFSASLAQQSGRTGPGGGLTVGAEASGMCRAD